MPRPHVRAGLMLPLTTLVGRTMRAGSTYSVVSMVTSSSGSAVV